MPTAYLEKDTFEWTGIIWDENSSFPFAYNLKVGGDSELKLICFSEDVEIATHYGSTDSEYQVTVSGKVFDDIMFDAEIVK